ncbi:hypothetical protein BDQ12DRAFT_728485 [Crucibulum laeve]|uniref:Uncharacterized protein n=1 Tax=Crucibulum laeve TaxID=68775 RepID=A0A5C3LIV5_9AGAR|nr:hypothetical protein BDQ12DRAFT_728485 [Crucibulum laeve]
MLLLYLLRFRNLQLESSVLPGPIAMLNNLYINSDEKQKMLMTCDALKSLTLSNLSADEDENFPMYEGEEHLRIFEHAPCLRHLVLHLANKSAPVLHLPWEMLTNLCVTLCSPLEVNRLVHKCPNLCCGSFSLIDVEDDDKEDESEDDDKDGTEDDADELRELYILEHLHSLLIVSSSSADVFKNIEFPALMALFLSFQDGAPISCIEALLPQFHNLQ